MTTPHCDQFRPLLSSLADDDVDERDQARLVAHLETCAACRGLLEDLRQIRATAHALGSMSPPGHVWLEIAGQIRLDESAPAIAPRPPDAPASRSAAWQWVGLAAALVLITFGVSLFQREDRDDGGAQVVTSQPAGNVAPTGTVEAVKGELTLAVQHYERAIAELEAMARQETAGMDTEMASVVQQNLGRVDQAIAESRTALTDDPANTPARDSLFEALRQKISVLQATVSLINQMRQGDSAGAARAAGRGKQS